MLLFQLDLTIHNAWSQIDVQRSVAQTRWVTTIINKVCGINEQFRLSGNSTQPPLHFCSDVRCSTVNTFLSVEGTPRNTAKCVPTDVMFLQVFTPTENTSLLSTVETGHWPQNIHLRVAHQIRFLFTWKLNYSMFREKLHSATRVYHVDYIDHSIESILLRQSW